MTHLVISLLIAGCGSSDVAAAKLSLDGPARVRVDQLGPVVGPRVVLDDGTEPAVQLAFEPQGVARYHDGVVIAEAPGEVLITASHAGSQVTWTLVVDPAMVLRIKDAPAALSVGDTRALEAVARIGDKVVDAGQVGWSSTDPEVLEIAADGSLTALGPGRVWVTATTRSGAQSMVEIDVR